MPGLLSFGFARRLWHIDRLDRRQLALAQLRGASAWAGSYAAGAGCAIFRARQRCIRPAPSRLRPGGAGLAGIRI